MKIGTGVVVQETDCNDPKLKDAADALLAGLAKHLNVAEIIGVVLLAVERVMVDTLHFETPAVEINIKNMTELLDELRDHVLSHVPCARHINKDQKEIVH